MMDTDAHGFTTMNLTTAYIKLNEHIGDLIFSGRFAGRAVYLTLGHTEQLELAHRLDCNSETLGTRCCEIVSNVLHRSAQPYVHITKASNKWRFSGQQGYPPFLALLYVLSYAAELMEAEGDFAANNYYVRLRSAVKVDDSHLRSGARSTEHFWKLLSRWLIDNDFELGRPTASSNGNWKYVSYPISQALIRASDRNLLQNIFVKYNFTPADQVTVDSIKPFVDDWMRSSQPNARLKSTWRKADLRQRIYEVACDSFYDWVETAAAEEIDYPILQTSGSQNNLSLILSIVPSFLKRKLALNVGQKNSPPENAASFKDEQGNEFKLGHHIYGTFATIDPNPFGANAALFSYPFKASCEATRIRWSPRLAIPFIKSDSGSYWSEVSRCSIGMKHIILVRDTPKMISSFEVFLNETSTGEAKLLDKNSLAGIPEGWQLYSDVCIIKSDVEVEQQLQPLLPLSTELAPQISDGIQISRGVWHSKSPISINYQAEKSPTKIEVLQPRLGDEPIKTQLSNNKFVSMKPNLLDGTYTVNFFAENKPKFSFDFAFRSADRPRPLHRQNIERIFYNGIIHSTKEKISDDETHVSGVIVKTSQQVNLTKSHDNSANIQNTLIARNEDDELMLSDNYLKNCLPPDVKTEDILDKPCIERGFHYWICETTEEKVSLSTPLEMQCKQCHMNVLMRNRGKKQAANKVVSRTNSKQTTKATNSTIFSGTQNIDHNKLYDALCYLGTGSVTALERLTADTNVDLWSMQKLLHAYSDLGLLDLYTPLNSNYSKSWAVPEAAALLLPDGKICLTGFRSDSLIEQLRSKVEDRNGTFSTFEYDDRPNKFEIENISANDAISLFDGINDPLGRNVHFVSNFHELISKVLRYLNGFEDTLHEITIGNNLLNLRKFDATKSKWHSVDDCREPGSYRFDHPNRIYCYKHTNGMIFRGSYNVVKLMAARLDNVKLHSYDKHTKKFFSTLGAEPTGLVSRALVLCAGELPSVENGQTIYHNVSRSLAESMLTQMYNRAVF